MSTFVRRVPYIVALTESYVFNVRGVPWTFWNADPEPERILKILSPAGLEQYFEEFAGVLFSTPPGQPPDFARIAEMAGRYAQAVKNGSQQPMKAIYPSPHRRPIRIGTSRRSPV